MTEDKIIELALAEDIGDGDHTSQSTISKNTTGKAKLIIKEDGVLCGVNIAEKIFRKVDREIQINIMIKDGTIVKNGDIAFTVEGNSISILKAERTVLNFMQRMSGIATNAKKYSDVVKGTGTKILDTRKTTPVLRQFEKYAVQCGGAENHRMGLYDMIMIKDNHVDFAGGIEKAINAVHYYLNEKNLPLKIEIEVRNFKELQQVINNGGVNRIMLDNFSPEDLKQAIEIIDKRYETEASGGITIENLHNYAKTGVDYISIGALTHHIKSLDMSLKAYC